VVVIDVSRGDAAFDAGVDVGDLEQAQTRFVKV
jgi:hypothetical protein